MANCDYSTDWQQQAFIAAIRERPEDDAPRLVFSDWLEENGEDAAAIYLREFVLLKRAYEAREHITVLTRMYTKLSALYYNNDFSKGLLKETCFKPFCINIRDNIVSYNTNILKTKKERYENGVRI